MTRQLLQRPRGGRCVLNTNPSHLESAGGGQPLMRDQLTTPLLTPTTPPPLPPKVTDEYKQSYVLHTRQVVRGQLMRPMDRDCATCLVNFSRRVGL